MFRIDSQGAVPSLPGPEPAGSTAGYFFKGNPAVGQKATVVSADWANAIQEEICYLIEQAGLQLNQQTKIDHTQLRQAFAAMIGAITPAFHTHDTGDIVSGTFADARIAASNILQYQALLMLDALQIVSGQFADARVSQSSVIQHQGAIDHHQIGNRGSYTHPQIDVHINDRSNPHGVTLGQIGVTTDHGSLGGLGDDDHPQYVHLNKSGQMLRQNLTVAPGIRIDNVDLSIHTHPLSLNSSTIHNGRQTRNISITDVRTIGGFTSSDHATCAIVMIDMTQGGGGFDGDNRAFIGGTSDVSFGGRPFRSPGQPRFNNGTNNWEFKIEQSAGNEDVVCGYQYAVMECTDNTGGPN